VAKKELPPPASARCEYVDEEGGVGPSWVRIRDTVIPRANWKISRSSGSVVAISVGDVTAEHGVYARSVQLGKWFVVAPVGN
jgi:hypothetical protein